MSDYADNFASKLLMGGKFCSKLEIKFLFIQNFDSNFSFSFRDRSIKKLNGGRFPDELPPFCLST